MQDDKKKELNKKRLTEDKIFNNGYKTGLAIPDDEYQYQASISVNQNYADAYLRDVYEYEETLEYNAGISKILELIENDPDLSAILYKNSKNTKIKLSKEEINWCFNQILDLMKTTRNRSQFHSPVYIVEALSSILSTNSIDPIKDYKKIFDSLEVGLQEELVIELDKKYGILSGKKNKKKIH